MIAKLIFILVASSPFQPSWSFTPQPNNPTRISHSESGRLFALPDHHLSTSSTTTATTTRRDHLSRVLAGLVVFSSNVVSAASSTLGTAERPVVIVGASGRTGMETAIALVGPTAALHAVTMTRSGSDPFQVIKLPQESKERLAHYPHPVDVRDFSTLNRAFKEMNPSGVIFAASASRQGGDAREVDDEGALNAAKAALGVGARFVLISALAVDRPGSKGYKVTNSMGGYVDKIMDRKLDGEEGVRSLMGRGKGDYVIVRPGVLVNGKVKGGAANIELNQGDSIGGALSREELAQVAVGGILSGKKGVTVEAYRKTTRTKLQQEFDEYSGKELTADTFVGLFDNAESDV